MKKLILMVIVLLEASINSFSYGSEPTAEMPVAAAAATSGRPIKIHDWLYTAALPFEGFQFVMEKVTPDTVKKWADFIKSQDEKIENFIAGKRDELWKSFGDKPYWTDLENHVFQRCDLYQLDEKDWGHLSKDVLEKMRNLSKKIYAINGIREPKYRFKERLRRLTNDFWIASINSTVDNTPLMVMTVTSAKGCTVTHHMGIFSTVESILEKRYKRPGAISMYVHSKAAQVMLTENSARLYMGSFVAFNMFKIFQNEGIGDLGFSPLEKLDLSADCNKWLSNVTILEFYNLNTLAQWTPKESRK